MQQNPEMNTENYCLNFDVTSVTEQTNKKGRECDKLQTKEITQLESHMNQLNPNNEQTHHMIIHQ